MREKFSKGQDVLLRLRSAIVRRTLQREGYAVPARTRLIDRGETLESYREVLRRASRRELGHLVKLMSEWIARTEAANWVGRR